MQSAPASSALPAASRRINRKLPTAGSNTNPASSAPAIAPAVFAAYARPTEEPALSAEPLPATSDTTSGNATPNKIATGNIASALIANCASNIPAKELLVARRIAEINAGHSRKKNRKQRASTAIPDCVQANAPSEIKRDCEKYRAKIALPSTMPNKNVASISVNEYVELPMNVASIRVQATSYATPRNPTKANATSSQRTLAPDIPPPIDAAIFSGVMSAGFEMPTGEAI